MDKEQVLQVIEQYQSRFSHLTARRLERPTSGGLNLPPNKPEAVRHLRYMCNRVEEMLVLVDQMDEACEDFTGVLEKVYRWLGFIQGVLWSQGDFSINELREHNTKGEGDEGKRTG